MAVMSAKVLFRCFVIVVISQLQGLVQAVDPCFDLRNEELGSIGNCIPNSACTSDVSVSGVCPSYPADYTCCFTDSFPGRESRGAWIATVANIDWPNSPSDSVATQKASLEKLIDALASAGINTIYFQVRPAGDALYQSNIEPWSRYLTGRQGQAPSPAWDPLQYVIEYSHARNVEVHAWINPYRASMSSTSDGLAENHMAKMFPRFAYSYGTFLWMDPGAEVVQNRTYDVALDLVTRYDLDGLHMDDYFYPYPVSGVQFPDGSTYAEYVKGGGLLARDDWRRYNVNKLVKRLNDGIHQVKPWVRFSISPFGIYRPCVDGGMPCSISGLDQYSALYSDPKLWLEEGWVDILQPQLYWKIDPPAQSYPVLLNWWVGQNSKGRHVYAGNYLSRVLEGWPLSEIGRQIQISRESPNRHRGSWGNALFSAQILNKDIGGAVNFFRNSVYPYPALPPKYPWLAGGRPKPELPTVSVYEHGFIYLELRDFHQERISGGVYKIVIFQHEAGRWEVHKIIRLPEELAEVHLELRLEPGFYAVHAEDRFGQESEKQYLNTS